MPLAQFRAEALELLELGGVLEDEGARLEGFVGISVDGRALGVAFAGDIVPLLDPGEELGVCTLGIVGHDDADQ